VYEEKEKKKELTILAAENGPKEASFCTFFISFVTIKDKLCQGIYYE